jgi:hypothetical protein
MPDDVQNGTATWNEALAAAVRALVSLDRHMEENRHIYAENNAKTLERAIDIIVGLQR